MGNFNWLVRTKVIKRIIKLFIVKIFRWHSIGRGSISHLVFKVLNVANGRSPRFPLPFPQLPTSGLLPGSCLCTECSSPCLLWGWLFLFTQVHWNVISTKTFSLRLLSEVLTLPSASPLHPVAVLFSPRVRI